jgi:hypothetical protein
VDGPCNQNGSQKVVKIIFESNPDGDIELEDPDWKMYRM